MSDRQIKLLSYVIGRLDAGSELTRELISEGYYDTMPKESIANEQSAEAWIKIFWEGCKHIPRQEFIDAQSSRKKKFDLLHKILT